MRRAAAFGYAAAVVAVLLAPSLVLDEATARGGAARAAGVDVVAVSALVALPFAAVAARRLGRRRPRSYREADRWLSSLHGLVVLALAASALPTVVLHATSRLQARVVDAEWPVLLTWTVLLLVSVLLAEGVRVASARWLAAERPRTTAPAGAAPVTQSSGARRAPGTTRG